MGAKQVIYHGDYTKYSDPPFDHAENEGFGDQSFVFITAIQNSFKVLRHDILSHFFDGLNYV